MKRMKRSFRYMMFIFVVLFLVCFTIKNTYAAEGLDGSNEAEEVDDSNTAEIEILKTEVRFKQAVTDENKIKVYIRNVDTSQNMTYQIGSIPVSAIEVYKLDEDRNPMRTLIMLDNSISIPSGSRGRITELMEAIVDAHTEKEVFRLATFSDKISYLSDAYSGDYTALKNVISSIPYNDQETYLTDVLYDLIDDLNKDAYMGYTRVIIISDGVDNKQLGVTREELNAKLKETPYPVYTIGTFTGKNNDQLENMFALSRVSGAEYYVLEDTETAVIVSELSKDAQMTVVEAQIPEEAKVGGKQSSKLLCSDGTQLIFDVHMPFHVRTEQKEPAISAEPEVTPASKMTESVEEDEKDEEDGKDGLPIMLIVGIIIGGIVLLVLVAVFIVLLTKKKKVPVDGEETVSTEMIIETETQRIDDEGSGGILPPSGHGKKIKYRVTLSDKSDMSRTYQCELKNSITLGKIAGNDIVVNAATVSKRHCMITNRNGRIFIQDLNSTNGTFVNSERINFETEIFSGTTIRMGKEELIAKFDQV